VYVARCDGVNRNDLMALLEKRGIPSRPYFTTIHLQLFYQEKFGCKRGDLPKTPNRQAIRFSRCPSPA
jgi:dTDP-4-amino-4,6-dideoxygalactose transaminase